MDSLDDELFPEERPDARHALVELFPEEAEGLKERRAEEILAFIQPKYEAYVDELRDVLTDEMEQIHEVMGAHQEDSAELHDTFAAKLATLEKTITKLDALDTAIKTLTKAAGADKRALAEQIDKKAENARAVGSQALKLYNELIDRFPPIENDIALAHQRLDKIKPYDDKEIRSDIVELRTRINTAQGGGGGAYRNIAVGGNSSVLGRYNDLNLKAGAGTTISYANNDTSKMVDITITATGSGSGIVRSVNNVSTSQTAGSTAGTDYVYICSAGVALTLPDAVGNTNLYTVKNTSASSVLVATTAAETIDGQSNLILATQYTSVDLISNGSNWDIT